MAGPARGGFARRVPVPAAACDCSVCPFWMANPEAIEPVCSGCNTDCAYCTCARAQVDDRDPAEAAEACGQCSVRCGSRVDIAAWMADVGATLRFDGLVVPTRWPAGLPRFVPQLDGSEVAGFDEHLGWPAYAVGLRRVFSPRTHDVYPRFRRASAREALGLRADQLAVLVGYGEDPLVEAFWSYRWARGLVDAVAAQCWDLVLAPNFSLYHNQPRAEHLLNFRRNLQLAAELGAAGVPAVANLYWARKEDLDRYLDWAAEARPAAVAVNTQTFRTDDDWATTLLPGLAYLAAGLAPEVRVVLTGASRAERIATLVELFGPRLVVVSQNPLQYARHGARMTGRGRVDAPARLGDLFAANVRYYAGLLEAVP